MTRMTVDDAERDLRRLVDSISTRGGRVLLERDGSAAVALVSADDARLLERLEELIDIELAYAALAEAETTGTRSWSEIREELGL